MAKLALITGGIRGIGAATAITLKQKGYDVVSNYLSDHLQAEKFSKEHGIKTLAWDVANIDECRSSVSAIEKEYGKKVSILVNNAGITKDSMMHKMESDWWNQVINVNLSSCFNMCNSVIIGMRDQGYGRIVNISSINAQAGQLGQTNYCASKAGIIGFTKALAGESAAKGITVNCIAPGYITTDMVAKVPEHIMQGIIDSIPVKRLGKPEEIARAIAFIVDEESGYITGETFSINGGHHMA
jgi:acetoacetyl-CoA reductase